MWHGQADAERMISLDEPSAYNMTWSCTHGPPKRPLSEGREVGRLHFCRVLLEAPPEAHVL